MLITDHWSATTNVNVPEYHIGTWAHQPRPPQSLVEECYTYAKASHHHPLPNALLNALTVAFALRKNVALGTATEYGTYRLNHDPRDGSADIEIAACCMGGERVYTTGPWGNYPFTAAHAVYLAQVNARVCKLKGLDPLAHFDAAVAPGVLQNGPVFVVSTHAERAIQTQDFAPHGDGAASLSQSQRYGYFLGSGDSNLRWDIAVVDQRDARLLAPLSGSYDAARRTALETAATMRLMTKAALDGGIHDLWGLDR